MCTYVCIRLLKSMTSFPDCKLYKDRNCMFCLSLHPHCLPTVPRTKYSKSMLYYGLQAILHLGTLQSMLWEKRPM